MFKVPRDMLHFPSSGSVGRCVSSNQEQKARFRCADQIFRLLQQNHKDTAHVDRPDGGGATQLDDGAIDGLALTQMLTASIKTMPMPVTRTANAVRSYSSQVQY